MDCFRLLCLASAFVLCTSYTREPQLADLLPLFTDGSDTENVPWRTVSVLVNTLVDRLLCVQQGLSPMECVQCLTLHKLGDLMKINGSRVLMREDVTHLSVLFLHHVLHFRRSCKEGVACPSLRICHQQALHEFSHPTGSLLEGVERVLRSIKDVYEPVQRTQCFSGETLLDRLNVTENDPPDDHLLQQITTLLIGHILKGDCINVGESVTDFMDDLFHRYGRGEFISKDGLERIIQDLQIKEEHHGDHDHSHQHHTDIPSNRHDHEDSDHHHHDHGDPDHQHDHGDHSHHHHHHEEHDHHNHVEEEVHAEENSTYDEPQAAALHRNHDDLTVVAIRGKLQGQAPVRQPYLAYLTGEDAGRHVLQAHEHTSLATKCFTAEGLLHTFGHTWNGTIDRTEFVQLCPALLQQTVSRVCDIHEEKDSVYQPTAKELYGYSSLAVLVISLCSLGGIFLLPILVKEVYHYVMMAFIGLSFSTMAGDALLHLIPQAVGLHSHEGHSHDISDGPLLEPYLLKQLGVLATIYCLFLFEAIMGLFVKEGYHQDTHGHGHSHIPQVVPDQLKMKSMGQKSESRTQLAFPRSVSQDSGVSQESNQPPPMLTSESLCLGLTSLALVVTLGDAVHNFGDGLAIGAAFASGLHSGLSTSVAVLCHELPHEFGDFVVLLSTGLSFTKALLLNMASALTCFAGLYLGILLGDNDDARQWIMATTAGIFLYVALTEMLPQLKEARRGSPVKMFLAQNLGVAAGIVFMVIIAMYEDHIRV